MDKTDYDFFDETSMVIENGEQGYFKARVLLVDDEPEVLWGLINFLEGEGYIVKVAESANEALMILPDFQPHIIFLDVKMPGMSGLDALARIRGDYPDIIAFILTAHESIRDAVQAIKSGACDYFIKPYHTEEIKFSILRALEEKSLKEEVVRLRRKVEERFDFGSIITADPKMFDIFDRLKRIAASELSILITGENGTGKELVAQAIHYNSSRKHGPFVPLDCATIPETLFESSVFGHEKGAFTGSVCKKKGFFEMAHKGTLFLDEIGNLKLENQSKFLRAIQERKVFPVGGKDYLNVDIRLISATNVDLDTVKDAGRFREDLYFRIKQFHVHLPPLRERPNDILLLARHFLKEEGASGHIKDLSADVQEMFMKYAWPGNVRELKNIVNSAAVLAEDIILPEHLSPNFISKSIPCKHVVFPAKVRREDVESYHEMKDDSKGKQSGDATDVNVKTVRPDCTWDLSTTGDSGGTIDLDPDMTFHDLHTNITSDVERKLIIKALQDSDGNKARAARAFGVDYKTFHSKIKELQIRTEEIEHFEVPESIMDISLSETACQLKDILKRVRERMEESLIRVSLKQNNWDKAKTARSLGIDYKTLFNKLHKYNLMDSGELS